MTATTIKVSRELRDRLKERAESEGRTISAHIEALLAEEERRRRFAALRRDMAEHPPDESYSAEAEQWLGEGWL